MGCVNVANTTLLGAIGRNCLQTNNTYNSQALYQTLQPTKWMNYEKLLGQKRFKKPIFESLLIVF